MFGHDPYQVIIENINMKSRINAIKIGDLILKNWSELHNKFKTIDLAGRYRVKVNFKEAKWANI